MIAIPGIRTEESSRRSWIQLAATFLGFYLVIGFVLMAAGKSASSAWIATLPVLIAPAVGIGAVRYGRQRRNGL